MGLLDGLISYWKLDEGTGATFADSHGNNDGTVELADWSIAGKIGNCLSYTRTPNPSIVSNHESLEPVSVSLSVWFRPEDDGASSVSVIAGKNHTNSGHHTYVIGFNSSRQVRLRVRATPSIHTITDTEALDLNEWHHAVVVFDRANNDLIGYVNGEHVDTINTGGNLDYSDHPFYLGGDDTGIARSLDGRVDEVGLWGRVLTAAEVAELYNNGDGLQYPFTADEEADVDNISIDNILDQVQAEIKPDEIDIDLMLDDATINIQPGQINIDTDLEQSSVLVTSRGILIGLDIDEAEAEDEPADIDDITIGLSVEESASVIDIIDISIGLSIDDSLPEINVNDVSINTSFERSAVLVTPEGTLIGLDIDEAEAEEEGADIDNVTFGLSVDDSPPVIDIGDISIVILLSDAPSNITVGDIDINSSMDIVNIDAGVRDVTIDTDLDIANTVVAPDGTLTGLEIDEVEAEAEAADVNGIGIGLSIDNSQVIIQPDNVTIGLSIEFVAIIHAIKYTTLNILSSASTIETMQSNTTLGKP